MRESSQRGRAGFFITLVFVVIETTFQLLAAALVPEQISLKVLDHEVGWVYAGHETLRSPEYGDYELRFNSLGMRGPEVSGPVPLMILGDSVTSGSDTPEPYTFATQLGAVNAGSSGYTTRQSARRYERDWQKLRPELLVFVITPHEFIAPDAYTFWDYLMVAKEQEGAVRLVRWMTGTSYGRDQNPWFARAVQVPPPAEQWESWWSGVQQVQAVRGNQPLIVVYMPPAAQVRLYQGGERDFWINKWIRRACDADGMQCIDLTPVLAQYEVDEIYNDHLHLSVEGHAMVAAALRRWISANVCD